ncbi:MAG: hypothetical protein JO020_08920 [Chloroflexi bacterium]|nr:hypothetical protein [Chloroflexota bacterium]
MASTIERSCRPGSDLGYCTADAGQAEVPHPGWLFRLDDVEAFVREHVDLLDVSRMQNGHPLTSFAQLEWRTQAWRSAQDLAAYVGLPAERVRRAARAGLIPHRRKPGAGMYGEIRVRARDFPSMSELLRQSARRR